MQLAPPADDPPPTNPIDDSVEEPSLAALLRRALRQRSDGVLVLLAAGGLIATAVLGLALPDWWRVTPPFALMAAAGVWGIGDRERASGGARGVAFATLRAIAILGALAASATLVLVVLGATLGTWIS